MLLPFQRTRPRSSRQFFLLGRSVPSCVCVRGELSSAKRLLSTLELLGVVQYITTLSHSRYSGDSAFILLNKQLSSVSLC